MFRVLYKQWIIAKVSSLIPIEWDSQHQSSTLKFHVAILVNGESISLLRPSRANRKSIKLPVFISITHNKPLKAFKPYLFETIWISHRTIVNTVDTLTRGYALIAVINCLKPLLFRAFNTPNHLLIGLSACAFDNRNWTIYFGRSG